MIDNPRLPFLQERVNKTPSSDGEGVDKLCQKVYNKCEGKRRKGKYMNLIFVIILTGLMLRAAVNSSEYMHY